MIDFFNSLSDNQKLLAIIIGVVILLAIIIIAIVVSVVCTKKKRGGMGKRAYFDKRLKLVEDKIEEINFKPSYSFVPDINKESPYHRFYCSYSKKNNKLAYSNLAQKSLKIRKFDLDYLADYAYDSKKQKLRLYFIEQPETKDMKKCKNDNYHKDINGDWRTGSEPEVINILNKEIEHNKRVGRIK